MRWDEMKKGSVLHVLSGSHGLLLHWLDAGMPLYAPRGCVWMNADAGLANRGVTRRYSNLHICWL